ncbi:ABC transporter ATP-binding protein [Haloarchaeobius sp. HME9146]|uniref:ABC transporter ATP-binding protein n=1 Tax=Haloarchaeobius sp. HME9146 TaxID=2978732 RepID=UPI0021C11C68|nr:ABC transporter ATP-binding protein [Haloarchaeobius sp. HME9146]MCT9096767.1 ABC transporter ATP-binding protein [Haloarchaeobius sp. HME9146]
MPAIETSALTKRFGDDVVAVDSLDLRVEEGEIFGFLGPNGAGKSTTINMLLDFHRPTSGSARVLGFDAQDEIDEIRQRVGVLAEGLELYDRLTAREHLNLCVDMKNADDDPDEVLHRVGLDDAKDRKVGGFSKGMQQRLALGMALVGDPQLVILDEPSSGLDPNGIQHMREILREEAANGTTVFFSSHILSEVEAVCDRVGIMSEGELVTVDTIDNLRSQSGDSGEVELTVEVVPDGLRGELERLDGVTNVRIEDDEIRAYCNSGTAKMAAIRAVDDAATVTDVVATETSLEELFNQYTGGGRDGSAEERGETAEKMEVPA